MMNAGAKDMAHFLIAQLNGDRFSTVSVFSSTGIAAMHELGIASGVEVEIYGLGWATGTFISQTRNPSVIYHGFPVQSISIQLS